MTQNQERYMKIAIIGVGSVGSAIATAVQKTGLAHEIILFDRDGIRARAAAEDLGHASAFSFDIKINAVSNYRAIRGCEIVIIAAGANQKPGETRTDLLRKNSEVIKDIIPRVMENIDNKNVKIIIVTNPLDVMVMLAQKLSKLPAAQVIGTGTMLDSARFKIILSRQLNVSTRSINSFVLGEHGDSSVVNWSSVCIGGIALDDFCKQTKISMPQTTRKTIEHRVKNAAYEIIQGRGATWDGIGAAVVDLLCAIVNDEKRVLTTSVVKGVGKDAVAMSMPRIIGAKGAITTLQPKMDKNELNDLRKSAKIIRRNFDSI